MRLSSAFIVAFALGASLLLTHKACSAIVNFQGTLYDFFGAPVQGGRVIAGTFKPGFNVSNYACTYGDFVCNTYTNNYSLAVADGNFIPLNTGVLTNTFGVFSGSGTSTATGSQIWIFGFTGSQPVAVGMGEEVLASGFGSSFLVPSFGSTTVTASGANQFIFGQSFNTGFQTTGLPFPEPDTGGLVAFGAISLIAGGMRQRSLHRA
jgi:hypothetical protein